MSNTSDNETEYPGRESLEITNAEDNQFPSRECVFPSFKVYCITGELAILSHRRPLSP